MGDGGHPQIQLTGGGTNFRIGLGLIPGNPDTAAGSGRDAMIKLQMHYGFNGINDYYAMAHQLYSMTHQGYIAKTNQMAIDGVAAAIDQAAGFGGTLADWIAAGGYIDKGGVSHSPSKPSPGAAYVGPGGISDMSASAQYSAYTTIDSYLREWGLESLSGWAWDQISHAGANKSAAAVLADMRQTPEYKARFPGMDLRTQNGLNPIKEENYIKFEDGAKELAKQYGLPAGFMSNDEVAQLIGHGVSLNETQDRIVNGFRLVNRADPQVKQMFKDYYGVGSGHLAAYFLNPNKAYDLLMKQVQSAEIGGIMKQEGVGDIGKGVSQTLAKQMTGSPGSMDLAGIRSGAQRIAPLLPLETAQVGMTGQATASQHQLLASQFGSLNAKFGTKAADNQAAIALAAQARTAGLSGGGGYAATQKGVEGAGSATT